MKKLAIFIIGIFIISSSNAQKFNLSSTHTAEPKKNIQTNKDPKLDNYYSNSMDFINTSSRIQRLATIVKSYNIANNKVYDNSEKATYDVVFKKNSSEARVIYNNENKILSRVEVYKNINLPMTLRVKILKENPGFNIHSNKVMVTYNNPKDITILYKVNISNQKQKKVLKFDERFRVID